MAVSFNRIPDNIRVPLFYAEVDASRAAYFQNNATALLIGGKTAEGTAAADVPALVTSAEAARALFGAGSTLAKMVETYRRNDSFGELWALPVADGAAVKAEATVTIGGAATASGVLSLYIANVRVRAAVAAGDSAATVAAALEAAIDAADVVVTASVDAAVVTLTAKNGGEVGNAIDLRVNFLGTLGGEKTPEGITVAIVPFADGEGNPSIAAGIAALGDEEYDFIACAFTDATSANLIKALMDDVTGRWSWSRQIYGKAFFGLSDSLANLKVYGEARNDAHATAMGAYLSPSAPWDWAAAYAAQAAVAVREDPARPWQTLPLIGIAAPAKPDRFTMAERNTLLYSGIATFSVGRDGVVRIERAATTYTQNAAGQDDPSYLDCQTAFTLMEIIRRLRQAILTKYPRHKLANDGTRFGQGQAIVTPNVIKAEMIAQYAEMESLGLVENVDAFKANLIVERNADDPNRVDVLFAPDLVNQLRIFALLAQFRLNY